jgi:hypothetical protein
MSQMLAKSSTSIDGIKTKALELRKYKCSEGHVMKLDGKRALKGEMNSCNKCDCDYEKAKEFLSC